MQRSTLVVVLLLAALLGAGVWWSSRTEVAYEEPLFPGVTSSEVVSVLVDHVERGVQVRIDRDPDGGWNLVDPTAEPADDLVLKTLMEVVDQDRLRRVPGEPDPETFGFEPPRVVFQVETRDGARHVAEIGEIDLQANSVHVRVRGAICRMPLRIDTTLDRELHSWKRPYAFRLAAERVLELHREGEPLDDVHRFGFELHAFLDNDGWRLVAPFEAGLHPGPMQLLVLNVVRMPIRAHLRKGTDPEEVGLDEPREVVRLVELDGTRHDLRIGHGDPRGNHVCQVGAEGDPFSTDTDSVRRLEIPIELLLDRRLQRAPREVVERLELARTDGPTLTLERDGEAWTVSESGGVARRADARRLERFLAGIEATLCYDVLEVGTLDADEVTARLRFVGAAQEWEVRVGAPQSADDVSGVRVQQAGDGIVLLLEDGDAEFLMTRADDLRDRTLTDVDELGVSGLVLKSGERERVWERDERGKWTREGADEEAWEILALVDPLLHLRAERYAPAGPAVEATVEVEVRTSDGAPRALRLGLADLGGDGPEAVLVLDDELAVLAPDLQGLPARIAATVAAE